MKSIARFMLFIPLVFILLCDDDKEEKSFCTFSTYESTYQFVDYNGFSRLSDGSYQITYGNVDDNTIDFICVVLPASVASGSIYGYSDCIWIDQYEPTNFYVTRYGLFSIIEGDNFMGDDFSLTVEKWGKRSHGYFSGSLGDDYVVSGSFEGYR